MSLLVEVSRVGRRTGLTAALAFVLAFGSAAATDRPRPADPRERVALELAGSVHSGMACTECHRRTGASGYDQPDAAACGNCHEDAVRELGEGVHRRSKRPAVARLGESCTTCHTGPHRIRPVAKDHAAREACLRCHFQSTSNGGGAAAIGGAFLSSVHGKKHLLGLGGAPDCATCHGTHRVESLADDGSPGARTRRVKACAQCHAGADARFAASVSHDSVDLKHRPVAFLVASAYTALILLVTAFFGTMIVLELSSRVARIALGRPIPARHEEPGMRFGAQQRLQHLVVVVAFVVLVLTGIPLLAAGVARDGEQFHVFGGVELAARLHRGAGVVLIAATLWHLVWLAWQWVSGRGSWSMWPGFGDLRELRAELRTQLLLSDEAPAPEGKYGWVEKLEYWAFGWGVLVMGLTGLLMWFPVEASRWLPLAALPVVQLVHGYEAILAVVSVFLWHLYQVHLKPGTFPMNWTWLTGRRR